MGHPDLEQTAVRQRYWRRNLTVTGSLLVIWFVVTFVVAYFARAFSFSFFGWTFSFWMGAQGALVVYCLIIWFYAWYMGRLDGAHRMQEGDD